MSDEEPDDYGDLIDVAEVEPEPVTPKPTRRVEEARTPVKRAGRRVFQASPRKDEKRPTKKLKTATTSPPQSPTPTPKKPRPTPEEEKLHAKWPNWQQRLQKFDLDLKYGPCVGITRAARYERAEKFQLSPPRDVGEILRSGLLPPKHEPSYITMMLHPKGWS